MKWISVKDRLPKAKIGPFSEPVLSFGAEGMRVVCLEHPVPENFPYNNIPKWRFCGREEHYILNVTHWAQLPKKP